MTTLAAAFRSPMAWAALAVAAFAMLVADAEAQAPTGGPDLGGYTFASSAAAGGPTWAFVDISLNGTSLVPALGDDTETALTLPFTFTYYGVPTTGIKVSSNGFLCFTHGGTTTSDCIGCCGYSGTPGTGTPNRFVAGYYGDLHCNSNPQCAFSHSWGTAGNRVFVVMINQSGCFPFPNGCNLTWIYKIMEASQCVEVHYSTMTDPNGGNKFAGTEGASPGGTVTGLTHYFAGGPGTLQNSAVRYCQTHTPPPACSPATQTIAPGGSALLSAAGGTPPYTWSVSPSAGVTPPTGTGATFNPTFSNAGLHTVTVTGGSTNTCTVNVVPPGCGYTVDADADYDLVDISTGGPNPGTPLALGDDSSITQFLPFTFQFCGVNYTAVRLSSNGYLCFGSSGPTGCTTLSPAATFPTTSNPRPAVFAYMADLFPPGCTGGATACTFYKVDGTAPDRVAMYQMRNVPFFGNPGAQVVSFEIKLFETSNCIEVHYGGGAPPNSGVSDPTNRRILGGYQDATGTNGYTYALTQPGFVRDNQAWSACPIPPFRANTDNYNLNEDQAMQVLPVLANDQNSAPGPITITGITPASKGTVALVGQEVRYTPWLDRTGPDSFTYTITNSENRMSTGTVNINLQAVNDAPDFTLEVTRVLATPEQGTITTPGWASGVQPAPATATDEANQGITFIVTSMTYDVIFQGNPMAYRTAGATDVLATDPPTTGAHAAMRFAPSGVSGVSLVCFVARDSGGNATVTNSFGATATSQNTSPERCMEVIENAKPIVYFEVNARDASPRDGITFDPCPGPAPRCTYDPDGIIVNWLWEFGDGLSSSAQAPSHAYDAPGEYMVRLAVWDDFGTRETFQRSVTVTVPDSDVPEEVPATANAPTPEAGADRIVLERSTVQLSGTQRGGDQVRYSWTQFAGPPVEMKGSDTAAPSFVAPSVATAPVDLVFALRVFEGQTASEPDYVTIRVVSANQAPEPVVAPVAAVRAGETVVLDASGSVDADGDALAFHWMQDLSIGQTVVALSDATAARATFTAPDRPGVLTFRLTVSDGRASSVDTMTVQVLPAAAQDATGGAEDAAAGPAPVGPSANALPPAGTNFVATGIGLLVLLAVAGAVVLLALRLRK